MEKRKHRRLSAPGLSVEISDGISLYKGKVVDISMSGVGMVDLPPRIDGNALWLAVVISGHDASFRMYIKPRWSILKGMNMSIGGTIVDPSWDWADFIYGCESERVKSNDRESRL